MERSSLFISLSSIKYLNYYGAHKNMLFLLRLSLRINWIRRISYANFSKENLKIWTSSFYNQSNTQRRRLNKKRRNWRKNYRKIAAKQFDEKLYHQRSKIETIFSMVKRKYNPQIKAKSRETQIQEGYHKLLTHNLDRLCKIISTLLEGFIRTHS